MDISATVLAAVMNIMNVETQEDCGKLESLAFSAMSYHQDGHDFDPSFLIELGLMTTREGSDRR